MIFPLFAGSKLSEGVVIKAVKKALQAAHLNLLRWPSLTLKEGAKIAPSSRSVNISFFSTLNRFNLLLKLLNSYTFPIFVKSSTRQSETYH